MPDVLPFGIVHHPLLLFQSHPKLKNCTMIEVINLSKSYGAKAVLKHIDVIFEPGKVYGLVGENGSGKTTFFRCLAEMEDYEGKIKTSFKEIKNHLGFLTAETYFLPKITGEEHIYLMADARKIKLENL